MLRWSNTSFSNHRSEVRISTWLKLKLLLPSYFKLLIASGVLNIQSVIFIMWPTFCSFVVTYASVFIEQSSWRDDKSLSWLRSSLPLIEIKGLLICSQELTSGFCAEPVQSSPHSYTVFVFKVCLNTIVCFDSDLKLHKFGAALADCNQVLEAQPLNVKALLRRGVAHQNKNNYEQVHIILCSYLAFAKLKWNGWLKNSKPVSD